MIVPWTELILKLTTVHEVCSPEEAMALKKTMVSLMTDGYNDDGADNWSLGHYGE
jgi:hypothetical protein